MTSYKEIYKYVNSIFVCESDNNHYNNLFPDSYSSYVEDKKSQNVFDTERECIDLAMTCFEIMQCFSHFL